MNCPVHGAGVRLGPGGGGQRWAASILAHDLPVALVDPQYQQQTDALGTTWMIDPQSNVRVSNGQTVMSGAGMLMLNGMQFSP